MNSDTFLLYLIHKNILPVDIVRIIKEFCESTTLTSCKRCDTPLITLVRGQMVRTETKYFVIDDSQVCIDCLGRREQLENYMKTVEELEIPPELA